MLVTVVVSPKMDPQPFVAWGRRFATVRGLGLELVVLGGDATEAPAAAGELDLGEGGEVRHLAGDASTHDLVIGIEESKPKLVVLARAAPEVEGPDWRKRTRRLFGSLHSDVLMLRVGPGEGQEALAESCDSVLVPLSGGIHSRTALGWARDLISEKSGGEVAPLFVEPDSGEVASDVGMRRLVKILKQAGIAPDSPGLKPQVVLADNVRGGIGKAAEKGDHDLLLIGAPGGGSFRALLFGTIPERLLGGESPIAIAVLRRGASLGERIRRKVERWLHLRIPQLQREERVALFENIETNARWSFDFMLLICLSTAIAGAGLMMNSTAVVIGAMLVAPLMTPLIGSGLALVQGNLPLMRSAARAITYGFFAALLIGILLGLCSIEGELTSEMRQRGGPGPPDLLIAFLSGVAASYCIARPNLSSALAGVAIAAALVPPIATVGIAISLGEFGVARGAAILFATNVVAIILGAALTFTATGIRATRVEGKSPIWVRRTILALVMCAVALSVPLGSVLLGKVAKKTMKAGSGNLQTVGVTADVERLLESEIEKFGESSQLESVRAHREQVGAEEERDGVTIFTLEITAGQVPDAGKVGELASRISEEIGGPVKIRVNSRLVVEGAAGEGAAGEGGD